MKVSFKALLAVVFVSLALISLFAFWRDKTFDSEGFSRLSILEDLEKNGLGSYSFFDIEDREFTEKSFSGKVVVFNLWASWCAPCLEEFPSLIKMTKRMAGKIVLVAVSQDENENELRNFIGAFPDLKSENILIVHDKAKFFLKKFGTDRLPESFIVSKEGKVIKKIIGTIDWNTEDAISYLSSVSN
jgi:cytochrome c biogenesis protein CcmG/thiol:disulfide interchange protein DsbE